MILWLANKDPSIYDDLLENQDPSSKIDPTVARDLDNESNTSTKHSGIKEML